MQNKRTWTRGAAWAVALMLPAVAGAALVDLDFSQESHLTDNFTMRNQGSAATYGWNAGQVEFTTTATWHPNTGYVNLVANEVISWDNFEVRANISKPDVARGQAALYVTGLGQSPTYAQSVWGQVGDSKNWNAFEFRQGDALATSGTNITGYFVAAGTRIGAYDGPEYTDFNWEDGVSLSMKVESNFNGAVKESLTLTWSVFAEDDWAGTAIHSISRTLSAIDYGYLMDDLRVGVGTSGSYAHLSEGTTTMVMDSFAIIPEPGTLLLLGGGLGLLVYRKRRG